MARIRLTFYTGSDDFSSHFTIEAARDWIRSRVSGPSVIETASGTSTGQTVDELNASDLARWLAVLALGEAKRGKPLNVLERPGKWVSIRPERVEAVGAEVDDDDGDDDARESFSDLFPDSPWLN
jgi:hypothetical protein